MILKNTSHGNEKLRNAVAKEKNITTLVILTLLLIDAKTLLNFM